ncbi:TetR family transcriptional regulator [Desulfovibrio psychrotolerans]|uniref:TetR family transcriptional regulator n=2 Tax=Desulfovibrio psychrotolerans TaxID=415242 RepID=A0A7J0BS07_9BACT|nr:TetR family transcriptional regulator [Desulfovibrio psychrotolerans]
MVDRCGHCSPPEKADAVGGMHTRQRILDAARSEFAKKGTTATVRDICRIARANIAAVNYHFGSKDGLLAAVLSSIMDETLRLYPMDGGVPRDAAPGERLYGFVFAFLCRILGTEKPDEAVLGQMLSEAFMRPLPQFEQYAEAHRIEVLRWLVPLLREISGCEPLADPEGETLAYPSSMLSPTNAEDRRFKLLARSIIAQILLYNSLRSRFLEARGGKRFLPDEIEEIARHITAFSLGGIHYLSEKQTCRDS